MLLLKDTLQGCMYLYKKKIVLLFIEMDSNENNFYIGREIQLFPRL